MLENTVQYSGDGIVRSFTLYRKIISGSRTDSFLAKDDSGDRVMLTFLNAEKIREKFMFKAYLEGRSASELEADASAQIEKYQKEFKAIVDRTKGIGSEHVAQTIGTGFDRDGGRLVVVSEYVPGVDLYYATRGLRPVQMISLFVQALDGLGFIHKSGFLHLNIKPARIRVDIEGLPPVVRFTDFGFAIPKNKYAGEYGGTSLYVAPEIIFDRREKIDERADLYEFAVTAYYCLTERHPTEHRLEAGSNRARLGTIIERETLFSPPSHLNKDVPAKLDEIFMGLLEKDPDRRPHKRAADLINTFYEIWPHESREMPHEVTTSMFED